MSTDYQVWLKLELLKLSTFYFQSFWSFIQRFTHRDTINQLKRLTHIKTETGVCRAWVKLAINDGLMESYLVTILSQPQVLRQYYNKTGSCQVLAAQRLLPTEHAFAVSNNYPNLELSCHQLICKSC